MIILVLDFLNLIFNINIDDKREKITKLTGKEKILFKYMSISKTFKPTLSKSFFCFNNSKIFKDSKLEKKEFILI